MLYSNLSRVLVLSCLLDNCCWLTVRIVVVDLCVLLPYVYLLYYVCIFFFTLNVGLLATGQYSEGPATGHLDTGFFLVSLCRKANAEMVPKIPSCHYILLM